jgi:hypothetical protein
MKRPNVLHRDGVGKHRAIAVKLQLMAERNDNECHRPAQAASNDQKPVSASVDAGRET